MVKLDRIITMIKKRRAVIVALAAAIVFATTYALILPAVTLDQETAEKQGGVDVPAVEEITTEESSNEADLQRQESSEDQSTEESSDAVSAGEELTFEGKGYTAAAAFGKDAELPENTDLEVEELTADDEDYEAWYDEALKAVQEAKGGDQVAGLEFAKFYDITLTADGEQVEPSAPVDVTISYNKSLKAKDADHLRVIHFVADEDGNLEPEVLKAKDVDATIKKGKMSETAFKAASFSMYAVVYTVDFEYTDEESGEVYQYSLEGGGKIKLSALFENIGIDADVTEVEEVNFSNPDLLKVSKDLLGDDWTLKSQKSFDTNETLTVKLAGGEKIVVKVTDPPAPSLPPSSDMADYLQNAVINAPTNAEGAYVIHPGETYSITLSFKESQRQQFPNSGDMIYTMPEGLTAINGSGNLSIKVTLRNGRTITVPNNAYTISNGVLTFNWSDDPNVAEIYASNNTGFSITFEGSIDENVTKIPFSDNVTKDIEINTDNSVSVSKIGEVDKNNDRIKYTVNVQSSGISKNVVVTDTVSGTGLTLDGSSINATSSKTGAVSLNGNVTGNSFRYTIPEMKNGEIITFTYYVDIDPAAITMTNGKVVTTADNGVKVTSDGDPDGDTENTHNTIEYTPDINKTAKGTVKQEEGVTTLGWTIVANPNPRVSMAGGKITDAIDSNSQSIMKYSGTGITVKVTDASGQAVRTDNVQWENLTNKTDSTWTYTVPETDAGHAYRYEITYTTDVNTTNITSTTTVKNHVTTDSGKESWAEGKVGPGEGGGGDTPKAEIKKTHGKIDLDNKEVTWTIDITVPAEGLNEAVVTDYYPSVWIDDGKPHVDPSNPNNTQYGYFEYERVKDGSVSVSGLQDAEKWDIEYHESTNNVTGSDPGYARITFYKDENKRTQGLNGGAGARVITVTLKTEISDEWHAEAQKPNSGYKAAHINKANLKNWGDSQDQVDIHGQEIKKSASEVGTRTVDGVELPIYKYEILLNGVSAANMMISDKFDTEILEPYVPMTKNQSGDDVVDWSQNPFVLLGGDQYYQGQRVLSETEKDKDGNPAPVPISHLTTSDGITFVTSSDNVPMNGINYYSTYKLTYYLTVKDEAALKKLISKAATSENGKYKLTNTAEWNEHEDSADVTYEYVGLDKEILTSDADLNKEDEEIYADFRITLNPGAQVLNDMEPLTMTDSFENLSILYDSIKATPSEGVAWDFSGSTATFTIPDATKVVIEYEARIVRTGTGSAKIHFSNTAEMGGFKDTIEKDATFTSTGGGMSFQNTINLLKYEAGDMTKKLSGAQFALYNGKATGEVDKDGYPVYEIDLENPVTDKNGDPVVLTTGEDGKIEVFGDEATDGWSIYASDEENTYQYYLREIVAPEGYMLSSFDYSFQISADGTTDYEHYIYHSSDTMSAKNYPGTDVHVNKVWSDGNDKHDADSVTVKLQQRLQRGTDSETGEASWSDWSDTIRMEDSSNNYEWTDFTNKTATLSKDNDWKDTFKGLPLVVPSTLEEGEASEDVDVEYRVVETLVNGEAPDANTVSIEQTQSGGAYVFTVTNTVTSQTGSLTVKKTVAGDAGSDVADKKFKIAVKDSNNHYFALDGTDKGTTAEYVEFTKDEEKTWQNLPLGAYTVVEDEENAKVEGYTLDVTVTEGISVAADTPASAEVTNTYTKNPGDLELTKNVAGEGADQNKEFTFTIALTAPEGKALAASYQYTKTGVSGEQTLNLTRTDQNTKASIGEIKLKHGETYTIKGLPAGTEYVITEADYSEDGYTPDKTGDQLIGTITGGTTTKESVEITNNFTQTPGDLELTKKVVDSPKSDANKEFEFTIALTSPTGKELAESYQYTKTGASGEETLALTRTDQNTKASVKMNLKADETFTIKGLPAGTAYTITETDYSSDGYSAHTTEGVLEGTITGGKTAQGAVVKDSVEVTNTYNKGGLTVEKVISGSGASKDDEFGFKVTIERPNHASGDHGTYQITGETRTHPVTFINGKAEVTFTLKGGQQAQFSDLQKGSTFTVVETTADQNDYTTTVAGSEGTTVGTDKKVTGTIDKNSAFTVTYTNTKSTISLDILKLEKDGTKKLQGATFAISRIDPDSLSIDVIAGSTSTETTDGNGALTFSNLVAGGYYQITETAAPTGYVLSEEPVFYVKTTEDDVKLLTKADGAAPKDWSATTSGGIVKVFTAAQLGTNAKATVENEPGSALPSTGGPGTTWIYLLGLILFVGCSVTLIARRRVRS